ncbi:MAG: Ig-like domain-containing protein [Rhodothermia bacterium]
MTEVRSKGYRTSVRRTLLMVGLFAGLSIITAGCSENTESGDVTLTGVVVDSEDGIPIEGAFVQFVPPNELVETDEDGKYTYTTRVDSTTEIRVQARKDGFLASLQVPIIAVAGRTIEVPDLALVRVLGADRSGQPSNINLVGVSPGVIGIKESGSPEVASVTFVVTDSTGIPVSRESAVEVRFTLGEQPGGGEFIFPTEQSTDGNGQVVVNLSSGLKAGAVQIVAEATVGDNVIRSLPVTVAIHGGLPDQTHFTLGPAKFNFPGLNKFGLTNAISVIVGDKYSNPVKPGTAVYFSTSHAVIEGSVTTNDQGRGAVNLISANPLPADGVAIITAATADEDQARVSAQTPVLLSGIPVVTVSPLVAEIGQFYDLTVTDQNGNPLVEATSIRVRADGRFVKTVGNIDVRLDDTIFTGLTFNDIVRGPGITEFQFGVVERERGIGETGTTELGAIVINVTGGNGALEVVLLPSGEAFSKTDGVIIEKTADGKVIFRLEY